MNINGKTRECFKSAEKDEQEGNKHKGLLIVEPSIENAKLYLEKAKDSLKFCEFYRKQGADYKIPEEWYYSLYYCALAILSRFGIGTRSQRCTALFLKFVKNKGLIEYNDEFINRIMVYKEKEKESDVDQREKARYGTHTKIKEVEQLYDSMMNMCKKAISECEEIVFSDRRFDLPEEIKR